MIMDQKQSKAKLHLADNADCATPGAMHLPDGNPNAERLMTFKNRKTGKQFFSIVAPWLLANVFGKEN